MNEDQVAEVDMDSLTYQRGFAVGFIWGAASVIGTTEPLKKVLAASHTAMYVGDPVEGEMDLLMPMLDWLQVRKSALETGVPP